MVNKIMSKGNSGKITGNKRLLFTVTGILAPILLVYLIFALYYCNHFYSNTKINGVSASNMNVSKAEDAINAQVNGYVLTLKERKGISDSIQGKSIHLRSVFDKNLDELLAKQNGFAWPSSIFKQQTIKVNAMLKYDKASLKKQIDQLNCFKNENIVQTENAHISEYGDSGYKIIAEVEGTEVNKQKLYKAVEKSIASLTPSLSLEDAGCYEEAEINSKNAGLMKALKKLNKIAGTKITYEFGSNTEILDGSRISKWLTVDKNCNVKLDQNGVKEFVDYLGSTYNTFGMIRTFKTSYNKVIKVKGGDYGWWLDRVKEVSQLTDLIMKGVQQSREPAYYQKAQQYGKNDIGNTYVEVNLQTQHLFFYKEGKLLLQTDVVTGNVSKKFGTPVGTYPIQYCEKDATLKGENYTTPVKYWMPFNGNIGLHDAWWRTSFGKKIYMTDGSHGCVNMPPAMAKKLFANVKKGVAVVVYNLNLDGSTKDTDKTSDTSKSKSAGSTDTSKTKPTATPVPTKKAAKSN